MSATNEGVSAGAPKPPRTPKVTLEDLAEAARIAGEDLSGELRLIRALTPKSEIEVQLHCQDRTVLTLKAGNDKKVLLAWLDGFAAGTVARQGEGR